MLRKILTTYRDAFGGLSRATWMLAGVTLVNRAGGMVIIFLTLYLTREKGYHEDGAGFFLTIYGLGSALGVSFGGWMTDRVGPVVIQSASLISSGLGFLVLGFLDGDWPLRICVFLVGAFGEAYRPAVMTLLALTCAPEMRSKAYALNRLAINLGQTLAPALGGFLALLSYQLLFVVDGLTCMVAGVLAWVAFRGLHANTREEAAQAPPPDPAGSPLRDGVFLFAIMLIFLGSCVFMQCFGALPLYLRDGYGFREDTIGILFALNPFIIVLFEMVLVQRLRHRPPLPLISVGVLLLGAGFAMFPLASGFLWAALAFVVITMGEMLESPFLGGFIANRAAPAHRGRYMAILGLAYSFGFMVGPACGTWIYRRHGPAVLFLGVGGLGAACALGYFILSRTPAALRQAESA